MADEKAPIKAEDRRKTKLSSSQTGAAKALIESGEKSVQECADMYKVSKRTLQRAIAAFGVTGASSTVAVVKEDVRAAVAAVLDDPLEKAKLAKEARETTRKQAEFYEKLLAKLISDPLRADLAISTKMNDIKTLLMATQALKNLKEVKFDAIGITNDPKDDGDKPVIVLIQEMDDQQVREASSKKDEDLGDDLLGGAPVLPDLEDRGVVVEGEGEVALKAEPPIATS